MTKWIEVQSFPGFSGNLTSWKAEILSTGKFKQTVRICHIPKPKRTEVIEGQIDGTTHIALQKLIDEVDFEILPELFKNVVIDDIPTQNIQIFSKDKTYQYRGPISTLELWQKDGDISQDINIDSLINLWKILTDLLPYKDDKD